MSGSGGSAKTRSGAPVRKNQIISLTAEDLTREGAGVGRYQGFTLFVPGLLPGETAEVLVLQVKKQYGFAKVLQRQSDSPKRTEPDCLYYPKCGGCQLRHMDYEEQLAWKGRQVYELIKRVGGVELPEIPEVLGLSPDERMHYRNKAQYPVQMVDGRMEAGFYAPHSHRLISVASCAIESEAANRLVPLIVDFCRGHHIPAYDEMTGQGLLRHILVRTGLPGEILVCLVLNGESLPGERELWELLRQQGVKSFSISVNRSRGNVILGERMRLAGGSETILASIGDLRFRISAGSFFQVNPAGTEKLYRTILEFAGLTGSETVWDAYCGAGTISLFLARQSRHVYGVEIFAPAVEDARANAAQNGITNADFFAGEAETVIPAHFAETGIRPDVIVVDPPRAGCDERLLRTILQMQPDRMIYVSCDPGTLARDLRILTEGGLQILKVRCTDMFPQTGHVESVILMSRGGL